MSPDAQKPECGPFSVQDVHTHCWQYFQGAVIFLSVNSHIWPQLSTPGELWSAAPTSPPLWRSSVIPLLSLNNGGRGHSRCWRLQNGRAWTHRPELEIQILPLNSCVILDKSLHLSEPLFLFYKIRVTPPSGICVLNDTYNGFFFLQLYSDIIHIPYTKPTESTIWCFFAYYIIHLEICGKIYIT